MTIAEKIGVARDLFGAWQHMLWEDAKVRSLLETLQEKVAASRKVSLCLGVFAACKRCEEEEGGSCCGAGIEDRYSSHLLLINLLLGKTLPTERCFANSCYFLQTGGCSLMARDILCINYLCPIIHELLAHDDLISLQAVTGEEMDTLFLLHEAVKQFTNSLSHDH
jgi:hypothetical protein